MDENNLVKLTNADERIMWGLFSSLKKSKVDLILLDFSLFSVKEESKVLSGLYFSFTQDKYKKSNLF